MLLNQAISEGQDVGGANQIIYSNYALPNTPLANLFGDNLDRLMGIRAEYDPGNIMGLTGGFRF